MGRACPGACDSVTECLLAPARDALTFPSAANTTQAMASTTRFEQRSPMPVSAAELFAWHMRPKAFVRLTPPWQDVRLEVDPGPMRVGAEPIISVPIVGPFRKRWHARITEIDEGAGFVDEQVSGPFGSWRHAHRFEADATDSSSLVDCVDYRLPFYPFGQVAAGPIRRDLERLFGHRHRRTLSDLRRHLDDGPRDAEGRPRSLRVAITGASGLVGTQLEAFLFTGGHEVRRLVRREPAPGSNEFRWDPAGGTVDPAALEGVDAVVHLAGATINQRWDAAGKARILNSRVQGTTTIAKAIAAMDTPPAVLVSASGTGYYGHRDAIVGEDAPQGEGFLAEVAGAWEASTAAASEAGVRVVRARLAVVLTPAGGALEQMLGVFRMGLGGPLGGGQQGFSWVSLDDVIGGMYRAISDDQIRGAINLAGPEMVTQREFAKTLGSVLGRPAFFPVPAGLLRAALGEMSAALLEGVRATPDTLTRVGYRFEAPTLRDCLRQGLGLA